MARTLVRPVAVVAAMNIPRCREHPTTVDGCGACHVVRWARRRGNHPRGGLVAVVGRCVDCGGDVDDRSKRCQSCATYKIWEEKRSMGLTGKLRRMEVGE